MPPKPVARESLMEAVAAFTKHGSKARAARSLGMSVTTFKDRIALAEKRGIHIPAPTSGEKAERFEIRSDGDTMDIYSVAHDVTTVEDAVRKGRVDMVQWEVDHFLVNAWEVVGGEIGRCPLWQVKVWFKRRVQKVYVDVARELAEEIGKRAPKYPKIKRAKKPCPHMLEIALYDAHFGKLAWEPETGESFDLKIAERLYSDAVDELLHLSDPFNVDEILFPIGQDFFHLNNRQGTTPKNQNQLDFDSRYHKIFKTGCRAVVSAIERCLSVAPVQLLWVPGNHDPETSWHLLQYVQAHFRRCDDVRVDDEDSKRRKYYRYGDTLLGMAHGDTIKADKMPLLMAREAKEHWADAKHFEIHTGHLHKRAEYKYVAADTFNGVVVRIIPSLCGTDDWHYEYGYVKGLRAAEGHLFAKEGGYRGFLSTSAI